MQTQDGRIFTSSYDADGRKTTMQLGLGTARAYSYDATGNLTTQVEFKGANPIATFVDTYDPVGNRTRRVQDGVQTDWTYDKAYRLLGQQGTGAWATFTYDSVGNTSLKWQQGSAPQTMSYDAAQRQTTSIQGSTISSYTLYDNAGNKTVEQAGATFTTFSYDPENRLSLEVTGAARTTYSYQGSDGLRRSKQETGEALITFVWDGGDYLGEVY